MGYLLFLVAFISLLIAFILIKINLPFHSGENTAPCELRIEHLALNNQPMPDLTLVENAVNKITVPEINCTIKLENVPISEHATKINLFNIQGTSFDIIATGRTLSLSEMVSDSQLLPLDDLLKTYGQELLEKEGQLLESCTINNTIYAISANLYCGGNSGFLYNKNMAEQYNISIKAVMSIEDIEVIATILHDNQKYLLSQGDGTDNPVLLGVLFPSIVPVGGKVYAMGTSLDGDNGTHIINIFETDEYLNYCRILRKWKENGWIPDNSLTSGQIVNSLFQDQSIFMTWILDNPIEKALQAPKYAFQTDIFSTTSQISLRTSQIQENGWGISSKSENPEKAMQFLNLMYNNAELANLLMNGIEGREYKKVSEHIITYPDHVSADNIGYSRHFSVFGDFMDIYQWQPVTEDFYQDLKDFRDNMTGSPLLGYTFDVSPVASEYAAVMRVLSEYLPPLECGMIADVEGAVKNMNVMLSDAGINQIIEENQRQLDLWLTDNL